MSNLIRLEWLPDTVVISTTGVAFKGDLPFELWSELMGTLSKLEVAAQWAIGDALNYGESRYGEKYTQAIEVTGLGYQALANYSWVARSVPHDIRNPNLSWTHHRAVSKLSVDEQKAMLAQAEEGDWTVDMLLDAIRGKPRENKELAPTVQIPMGVSHKDAEHALATVACVASGDATVCPMCPYRRDRDK